MHFVDPRINRRKRNQRYKQKKKANKIRKPSGVTKKPRRRTHVRANSDSSLFLRRSRRLQGAREDATGIPCRWAFIGLEQFQETISLLSCPQCHASLRCDKWKATNGSFEVAICCTNEVCAWETLHVSTPKVKGTSYFAFNILYSLGL